MSFVVLSAKTTEYVASGSLVIEFFSLVDDEIFFPGFRLAFKQY